MPIDCAVDYPNPYSLETLIRNPVRRSGNHCVQIFSVGKKLTISKIGEFPFLLPKGALDYQMEEQYKELFDAPVLVKGFKADFRRTYGGVLQKNRGTTFPPFPVSK